MVEVIIKATEEEITALTPETDLFGGKIEVGCKVRSFDFPLLLEDGRILGLDTHPKAERVGYIEGIVKAIGEHTIEGCPRYKIDVTKRVYTETHGKPPTVRLAGALQDYAYPPVNGTPATINPACFGVVAIS